MDRGNTKQDILEAALELFSVQGFESTSISQIAIAVGIRKASLYSHFESKQAILDELVQVVLEQYEQRSLFARGTSEKDTGRLPLTCDDAVQMIGGQRTERFWVSHRHIGYLNEAALDHAEGMAAVWRYKGACNDGSYS